MDMVGGREDERYGLSNMEIYIIIYKTDQFSSAQLLSHVRLCDAMDCRAPGLAVHHQLLKFTQTHVH